MGVTLVEICGIGIGFTYWGCRIGDGLTENAGLCMSWYMLNPWYCSSLMKLLAGSVNLR
jgi:hypothetical protein